jgi:UDPglucose 6-dehydrogenase
MKISIIGTGYVGLVTGTCLAQTGNDVLCKDMSKNKITQILLLSFSKSLYLS